MSDALFITLAYVSVLGLSVGGCAWLAARRKRKWYLWGLLGLLPVLGLFIVLFAPVRGSSRRSPRQLPRGPVSNDGMIFGWFLTGTGAFIISLGFLNPQQTTLVDGLTYDEFINGQYVRTFRYDQLGEFVGGLVPPLIILTIGVVLLVRAYAARHR